ncbi:MAG: GNAT family N-acetyltransferase [Chloroflexota bacterium]|jgi:ribosomal protein S18 acetylase RimI-like enzyme
MKSSTSLALAIESNLVGHWSVLGRSPKVELHETEELTWFRTGYPVPRLNRILRARFNPDAVEVSIEAALAPFKERSLPLYWHVGPSSTPSNLGEYLLSHGLQKVSDELGMAVDLATLREELNIPAGLTVERVDDKAALKQWCIIFSDVFGGSENAADAFYSIEVDLLGKADNRKLFVGYQAGEPVATALLLFGAGVAGLYGIGTIPEARRQGIGTAMTMVALNKAKTAGYQIATLHASSLGQGIYRQLGFNEYCILSRYKWE